MEAVLVALTPLVIAGLKQALAALEKKMPPALIPALAPIVAVLVSTLMGYLGWLEVGAGDAAMLGMAGVGAREIVVKTARSVGG